MLLHCYVRGPHLDLASPSSSPQTDKAHKVAGYPTTPCPSSQHVSASACRILLPFVFWDKTHIHTNGVPRSISEKRERGGSIDHHKRASYLNAAQTPHHADAVSWGEFYTDAPFFHISDSVHKWRRGVAVGRRGRVLFSITFAAFLLRCPSSFSLQPSMLSHKRLRCPALHCTTPLQHNDYSLPRGGKAMAL